MADVTDCWAVLSPHLDDAVFSLGATMAAASRSGVKTTVITVLAGDPESDEPAGAWDAAAGFGTAGEAARSRRQEDRQACSVLGVEPVWLPFADRQYGGPGRGEEVLNAVESALAGVPVVVAPGFPLVQPDHHSLTHLLLPHLARTKRLGVYVEQPYGRRHGPAQLPSSVLAHARTEPTWKSYPATAADSSRKRAACRAYRSQLPLLTKPWKSRLLPWRITGWERLRGGERIAWLA